VESDLRYYERRASEERRAALRAVTPAARERHAELAELFAGKAQRAAYGPEQIPEVEIRSYRVG